MKTAEDYLNKELMADVKLLSNSMIPNSDHFFPKNEQYVKSVIDGLIKQSEQQAQLLADLSNDIEKMAEGLE